MDVTVKVCDVCEEQNAATESIDITRGRAARHLDLCDKHAAPILLAFEKGSATAARSRRGSGGGKRLQVTSVEEIESRK